MKLKSKHESSLTHHLYTPSYSNLSNSIPSSSATFTADPAISTEAAADSNAMDVDEDLADLCCGHFDVMEVNEKEVLPWFVYSVRNRGRLLKLTPPLPKLSNSQ